MDSGSSQIFNLCNNKTCFPEDEINDEHSFLDNCIGDDDDKWITQSSSENTIYEPYLGKEFNSRDEARDYYIVYGRRTGFTVRIHHNRRSRINNEIIGQDFVCSKEGFREKKYIQRKDRVLPPPPLTREGCPAMLRVALKDGVKWIVTKFIKDHNHSLLPPSKVPWKSSAKNMITQDEKDKKIRELTIELQNERQKCKRKCAAYQEQVESLLKYMEEHSNHLSKSVEEIVHRIKEVEE